MNRDDAVWYYRLGGQTLGPVAWTEIEQLTRDTMDAHSLLVARGGDAGWTPVSEVVAAHPELAEAAAGAPPAGDAGWSLIEEDEGRADEEGDWVPAEPSSAAAEVLGSAATARDTGPAHPQVAARAGTGGTTMPIRSGLGAWISQAWDMVIGDAGAFILGGLLAVIVTVLTFGICGPPMQAGIFVMAVKRYRNEPITAGTVFEGLQYFLPAWGVVLVQGLIGAVIGGLLGGALGAALGAAGVSQDAIAMVGQTLAQLISIVVAAAFFYAFVLVVDGGMGTIEALRNSWAKTQENLPSYIGIVFVLQLIVVAGALACGAGLLITAPMFACATVAAYMYHYRNV